ncbi:zinc protease PQQL-like [Rutidosis leptorrhynchoides]|uniref:zinc protease PQQL-like n=1 Tax=Rutidosis leptorrhynchoides TaxID=125765 RepID=UPI003A997BB7
MRRGRDFQFWKRGVAHKVEHIAFSATKRYTNHDIVDFLESIGTEFGACQNAVTSSNETIYDLFVPVDKPHLLSQALSILAEFSTEIRISADDLEKEKGVIMEEYRAKRNVNGKGVIMYAERLPIGLEEVIRSVSSSEIVTKWYHLQNMVVIIVGDFSDTQIAKVRLLGFSESEINVARKTMSCNHVNS